MLMLNHTESSGGQDTSARSRSQSTVERSPPRMVEISSNPGSPLKVTEIKTSGNYIQLSLLSTLAILFQCIQLQITSLVLDLVTWSVRMIVIGYCQWKTFDGVCLRLVLAELARCLTRW